MLPDVVQGPRSVPRVQPYHPVTCPSRCCHAIEKTARVTTWRLQLMPFKVQVGPPQIAIHQAMTVLVSESDGQIRWPSDKGLYFFDTRVISAWSVYANGTPWDLLNGGAVNFDAARIFLTNQAFLTEDGPIPKQTLAFRLSRVMGQGLHEDLDITNHSQKPIRFNLEISIRSDFADVFDV